MTKLRGTPIPEDFQPNESTLAWLAKRYPQVDVEIAVERWLGWACNYSYQNHQKTFQNWLNREADANKLGPLLKRTQKPNDQAEWDRLQSIQRRLGLNPPNGKTLEQYRAYIESHAKPIDVSGLFK